MTERKDSATQKRVSRACLFCRGRKSRCDLDVSGGQPPCKRCKLEGRECVLGGSNRGGSRVRKKPLLSNKQDSDVHHLPHVSTQDQHIAQQSPLPPAILPQTRINVIDAAPTNANTSRAASPNETSIPQNPSDAWQLLTNVAKDRPDFANRLASEGVQQNAISVHASTDPNLLQQSGLLSYRLVREQYLTPDIVHYLVARYFEHYHCYLPIVPRGYANPASINEFAAADKHLLTAVLTIASKDMVEQPNLHQAISRYMHDLISGIAAGYDCDVEAVEALLLLAEWEPQGLRNNIEAIGRGEEDRSAWMHVGMALRTGYFLGLDRTSFREDNAKEALVDARKRLAWANCYISDRLISIRIGKAFWSRGPGPITGLSHKDFPTIQPASPGEENYANIFQATLDLTQLYSNVHDVLYSGMRSSGQMMLMGDYVKYVDDFRAGIERWYTKWGKIECSHHIKVSLDMSYHYLKLYTNAFVFQAQISQAIAKKQKDVSLRDHLRRTFSNIGSLPDARFIWGSVTAAKAFLAILASQIDPIKHLRYMPLRFYLYSIYSAVFLYKARSFGVMQSAEERSTQDLIHRVMDVLRKASLSPQDPGSRYARLLELLWMKQPKGPNTSNPASKPMSTARSNSVISSAGSLKMDAGGQLQYSPANNFSWLDLEAVGDYVAGDPTMANGGSMLTPLMNYSDQTFMTIDNANWDGQGMVMNNFMYDPSGNLLF